MQIYPKTKGKVRGRNRSHSHSRDINKFKLLLNLLAYALGKSELVKHLQWSLLDKTESVWKEEGKPDEKPVSSPEV